MLLTGNQLRAARALSEVDQQWVADRAEISVNTIRNMEARGKSPITSGAVTLRKVQSALEAAGVEFTNGGQPGVRLVGEPTIAEIMDGSFEVRVPIAGRPLPHNLPHAFGTEVEAEQWLASDGGRQQVEEVRAKYTR
jgi:hypothetical protein